MVFFKSLGQSLIKVNDLEGIRKELTAFIMRRKVKKPEKLNNKKKISRIFSSVQSTLLSNLMTFEQFQDIIGVNNALINQKIEKSKKNFHELFQKFRAMSCQI